MKLARRAALLVADAQHEASRRKHGVVGAEHLLRVLIEHGAAWRAKLPPPCRDELRAIVVHALDALPLANAYRDGAAAPALAADVVEALRPSKWSVRERALEPKDLVLRLALVPRVRDWIAQAMQGDVLVEEAIDQATYLAQQRGHLRVEIPHFLRVVAVERWFDAPPRLVELVDRDLAPSANPQRVDEPTLREDLAVLVAKSKVYARMAQRPATSDMLLAIALREPPIHALFEEAGMHVPALLQFLGHGTRTRREDPEHGMVDVVFHNDDFTPIEVVKDMLLTDFDLTKAEAKARIETAHETGEVLIGTYAAPEARARADRSRLQAHELRYPLRIVLRPAR